MPAKNKNAWESEMPGTAADRPVTRIASPADRNARMPSTAMLAAEAPRNCSLKISSESGPL